jgi:hypothetical protein
MNAPARLARAATAAAVLIVAPAGCGGGTPTPAPPTAALTGPATSAGPAPAPSASSVAPGTPVPVESNPPGDIPDTVAFVRWTAAGGRVSVTHPEGWTQVAVPGGARFSDKLNSVAVTAGPGTLPSVAQARTRAPGLAEPGRAFELRSVESARLPAGQAVRVVWRVNSPPAEVTGKVYRDEVVTYLVAAPGGRLVRLDLAGPVGSDNVDPYRTMSESLTVS